MKKEIRPKTGKFRGRKHRINFMKKEKQEMKKIENIIKMRLDYCQRYNGLPYCKNCGLCEEDLKIIKNKSKIK